MRKRWLIVCAVATAVLLSAGVAFAVVSSFGPVRVASADAYASNGDLISGWHWLRDPQLAHYARWDFSELPTKTADARSGKVVLRFDPLVTNKAGGGSGYDATVLITYKARNGLVYRHSVRMKNDHPELKWAGNTNGWGYSAMGYTSVPVARIPLDGKLTVYMRRTPATRYHVAGNEGAATVEWLKP